MDPVDRTFDAIYHTSRKVANSFDLAVGTLSSTASSVKDSIVSTYGSTNATSINSTGFSESNSFSLLGSGCGSSYVGTHKAALSLTGATLLSIAGWLLLTNQSYYSSISHKRHTRRRAERLANGARKDVILIVGSVTEPLTRFVANDLENRGFIVYITSTNSNADLKFFNNESIQDIKSLIISNNFRNETFNKEQLAKFDFLLCSDHIPFQGATPNKLNLTGILFIPDLYFPSGKFHSISHNAWTYNVENKMLLSLNLLSDGLIDIALKFDSNLIFITPSLSSSLSLTYHSVENLTSSFLEKLSENLSHDYQNLNVTNLKLGAINITSNSNKKTFGIKGDPIKSLFYKIFDLLYSEENSSVEYVGFGARFLDWFGSNFIARWLVQYYFAHHFSA